MKLNKGNPTPAGNPFNEQQRIIYEKIITGKVIHSYAVDYLLTYVCKLNQYVFIHYTITMDNLMVSLHYKYSHSVTHIDIP